MSFAQALGILYLVYKLSLRSEKKHKKTEEELNIETLMQGRELSTKQISHDIKSSEVYNMSTHPLIKKKTMNKVPQDKASGLISVGSLNPPEESVKM